MFGVQYKKYIKTKSARLKIYKDFSFFFSAQITKAKTQRLDWNTMPEK